MDENDLPTASLQLELKKSPPVTYKCVNHPCLWQEFQVIALFPACVHCLFLSGTIDIIVCSPLLQKFSSDGRAAKHIHTKIPWRFPSIMIDVRKCLYVFSYYVQNRWYVCGSKRMAYILPKLHRIQASISTWFSASPFFQNVEVDSASLFLAGFIILMDLFGLLVAAFYLRLWGNTRAKMGQQVEVQSWWSLMRGMGWMGRCWEGNIL